VILGAAIILGGQGLLVWGTQYLSSGVTALLNSTIPLWVAIFATLAFKQRLTKGIAFGLALGFMGLIILINPFEVNATLNLTGILSLTLSSIFWAVGSLYSTRSNMPVSILASGGMLMFVGGLMLFFTSYLVGEFNAIGSIRISSHSLSAFLYLIFLCTVVGYAEFLWLLRVESANIANSFAYIVPVVAVVIGWVILKEAVTVQTIASTCVILVGVALMINGSSSGKPSTR
jgi:drug/metabolite transporter (DMT)-like permease